MVTFFSAMQLTSAAVLPPTPEWDWQQLQKQQQEKLWEDLFSNPSHWWDYRPKKTNPKYPDFRHKASKQALWLNSIDRPNWVDSRLPSLQDAPKHQDEMQHDSPPSDDTLIRQKPPPSDDTLIRSFCRHGNLDEAVEALSSIHKPLAASTYKTLLQKCGRRKALDHAKVVQDHLMLHAPTELDSELGITLVIALTKCGAIEHARNVSDKLKHRTVVSWTAMLTACLDCGNATEALRMLPHMEKDGIEPNSYTFVGLFKACAILKDLELGRKLHVSARQKGLASDAFVGSSLIGMYSKGGAIAEAEEVFCELLEHDIVTWTAMMAAYVEHGQAEKALLLYRQMQALGLDVDPSMYVTALQACTILAEREEAVLVDQQPIKLRALEIGRAFHADADKYGFATNPYVRTALLSMYGKCGAIKEAEVVFSAIAQHDPMVWRAMLSAYVEMGESEKALRLYTQIQEKGTDDDHMIIVIALQACALLAESEEASPQNGVSSNKVVALEIGGRLVADIQMSNFASDASVLTGLITIYAKCEMLAQAETVFCELSTNDIVSWNGMLSAYVQQDEADKALQLFSLMIHEHVSPDRVTFVTALKACARFAETEEAHLLEGRFIRRKALDIGRALFADAEIRCFASDVLVRTALLVMYGNCGAIKEAEEVFFGLSHRSVVSWNAILLAYLEHNQAEKAADLFKQMQKNMAIKNDATFVYALQAGQELGSLELCKQVHFEIVSSGFDKMPYLASTLVHAYGSCASIMDAQAVFNKIPEHERDIVQWNACISAYANGVDTD